MAGAKSYGLPRISYPIPSSAVSFSASPRLLGRYTAGAGPAEEIALASYFSIAGGTLQLVDAAGSPFVRKTGDTMSGVLTINLNTVTVAPPAATLFHLVSGDGINGRISVDSFAGNSGINARRANGTAAAPSALASGDIIGRFSAFGYGTTSYSATSRASIQLTATENWTDAAQGAAVDIRTNPNGSNVADVLRWRFAEDGCLRAGALANTGNGTINASAYFNAGSPVNDANRIAYRRPFTFATLPAAAGVQDGFAVITDGAAAPAWGAAAAGGGAVRTPVWSNGAAWLNG